MIEQFIHFIGLKLMAASSGVVGALITSALVVIFLIVVEMAVLGWQPSSLRRLVKGGATAVLDVMSALLVLSNFSLVIGTVLSFGVFYLAGQAIKVSFDLRMLDYASQPMIAYGAYILALDFTNYWAHRWMHRSSRLWQIHRFHHSATEMTMLTALRDHPLERALLHGVSAIPASLFGIPPVQFLTAILVMQAIGYIKHSNFNSNWGLFGRWVIQSPVAHRLHHSIDPADHDCNFASIFQFWDVMFGTAKQPNASRIITIGVDGESTPGNPLVAIWRITTAFYATFTSHR